MCLLRVMCPSALFFAGLCVFFLVVDACLLLILFPSLRFQVGLEMLHDNGTAIMDVRGRPIQSYTTEDVQTLARAWTGFARAQPRGNIELAESKSSANMIDPTEIVSAWRDHLPKRVPTGGYIGDTFPVCSELPPHAFLRPRSTVPVPGIIGNTSLVNGVQPQVVVNRSRPYHQPQPADVSAGPGALPKRRWCNRIGVPLQKRGGARRIAFVRRC